PCRSHQTTARPHHQGRILVLVVVQPTCTPMSPPMNPPISPPISPPINSPMNRINSATPQSDNEVPVETNHEVVDDYVYLIGRPTLRQFLGFVKNRSLNGRHADPGALTDEWRAAASHICQLEKSEAGLGERPGIQPLPRH